MALSNRERVGRAFELLGAGLGPWIDRRMRSSSSSGGDWLPIFAASARPPVTGPASLGDPALQLRVLTESWDTAFRSELSRADRNLVFELRDVRNRWAHNEAFSVDDAYRALDSVERLLVAVDAGEATEVGRSKEDLMRQRFDAQARRATPASEALLTAPAAGLRPWRDVIAPHDDVARGRFSLAEFAADLHQVWLGQGAAEYTDPVAFFRRTFLTAGLRQLLGEAVARICGTGGSPVVDLQTSFGGGKTHSMIALYQLFSGTDLDRFPEEVAELVHEAGVAVLPPVRRAVLVGTRLSPGQGEVKPDGTEVGTMWGELAWQLGGPQGFAMVAGADRTGTSPGDALRRLLAASAPCLILIDEWVAYARQLYADEALRAGTFDTHFSFAQALTEAAGATEGVLVVVSLPGSEAPDGSPIGSAEVGGAGGREALRRLRAVVGRVESSWRPASAEESFEIVRRRLFQAIGADKMPDRDATARVLGDFYRRQASEFPTDCRDPAYVRRIEQAYPIHPELFTRLYEDWSTLERFQRTRGVLRLMATVIHALWAAGDQSPLILPASIPLADSAVMRELTRNLEEVWQPIIDAEIDGPGSLPRALDDEFKNLGRYLAARRVARTVFLATAPRAGSPNQGVDAARVRLGCALPGETVAIYGDALSRLADRATYFYAGGGRYWYATQPSVGRSARDISQRLLAGDRHEVRDEIIRRLRGFEDRGRRGNFAGVHAAPGGPADVADVAEARLVILGSDWPHPRSGDSPAERQARAILDSRGSAPRDHRNMLVFLAADQRRIEDLDQAAADYLAWRQIAGEAGARNLDPYQASQAETRQADADRTVSLRLNEAYQWLLVPHQPVATGPMVWETTRADGQGSLVERASHKLVHTGGLYVDYPPVLLRLQLDGPLAPLWEAGHVTVNQLWEAYSRYLYLHRLRDIEVLCACVSRAPASTTWATDGLAVAEGIDQVAGSYVGLAAGEVMGPVRGTNLVVRPAVAETQLAALRVAGDAAVSSQPVGTPTEGSVLPGDEEERGASEAAVRRLRSFYATASVDPARLARDAGRIGEEVVAHLNALVGTEVEVTIEVRATKADGFPDDVVRIVNENAATLRFRIHDFEKE